MVTKVERALNGQLEIPKGFGRALTPKKLPKNKDIVAGFDIEADADTASPYLITYCINKRKSYKAVSTAQDFIEFFTRFSFRSSINFFYNLQYDFEGLLKLFPQEVALMIYGGGIAHLNKDLTLCKDKSYAYKVHYIPKKAFHIKIKGGHKYSYFDLLQYYQMGLSAAGKRFLGHSKEDFDAKASCKDLFELQITIEEALYRFEQKLKFCTSNYELIEIREKIAVIEKFPTALEYRNTLLSYALTDAEMCRDLGILIVDGIHQFAYTKNFNSTASISEYYFRSNGLEIPQLSNWRYKQFLRSYYGGRFEITRKGFIPNVNFYDIKSAYPAAMADMPILSQKPIIRSSFSVSDSALYGSYRIDVNIPDLYLSPLPVRDSVVMFPTGKFTDYWVDKVTLGLLDNMGIDYRITKGVEIFDENATNMLNPLMMTCYNIKEDKLNQPEPVRLGAKINMNSLYGKFIQLIDDTTLEVIETVEELESTGSSDLFNIGGEAYRRIHTSIFKTGKLFAPFYASYITAHTRAQLYETALKVGLEKVVGFHTDSIILDGATIPEVNRLGGWEAESLNTNIKLLKTGMYECVSGDKTKIRARGVGKQDTILKPSFDVKRRYGLNQAIRKNFADMNIIRGATLGNNLNTDKKRVWPREITIEDIQNGEFINSIPKKLGKDGKVINADVLSSDLTVYN